MSNSTANSMAPPLRPLPPAPPREYADADVTQDQDGFWDDSTEFPPSSPPVLPVDSASLHGPLIKPHMDLMNEEIEFLEIPTSFDPSVLLGSSSPLTSSSALFSSPGTPKTFSSIISSSPLYNGYYASPSTTPAKNCHTGANLMKLSVKPIEIPFTPKKKSLPISSSPQITKWKSYTPPTSRKRKLDQKLSLSVDPDGRASIEQLDTNSDNSDEENQPPIIHDLNSLSVKKLRLNESNDKIPSQLTPHKSSSPFSSAKITRFSNSNSNYDRELIENKNTHYNLPRKAPSQMKLPLTVSNSNANSNNTYNLDTSFSSPLSSKSHFISPRKFISTSFSSPIKSTIQNTISPNDLFKHNPLQFDLSSTRRIKLGLSDPLLTTNSDIDISFLTDLNNNFNYKDIDEDLTKSPTLLRKKRLRRNRSKKQHKIHKNNNYNQNQNKLIKSLNVTPTKSFKKINHINHNHNLITPPSQQHYNFTTIDHLNLQYIPTNSFSPSLSPAEHLSKSPSSLLLHDLINNNNINNLNNQRNDDYINDSEDETDIEIDNDNDNESDDLKTLTDARDAFLKIIGKNRNRTLSYSNGF